MSSKPRPCWKTRTQGSKSGAALSRYMRSSRTSLMCFFVCTFLSFPTSLRPDTAVSSHGAIKIRTLSFLQGWQDPRMNPSLVFPDLTTETWLELKQCLRGIYGVGTESTFSLFRSPVQHSSWLTETFQDSRSARQLVGTRVSYLTARPSYAPSHLNRLAQRHLLSVSGVDVRKR